MEIDYEEESSLHSTNLYAADEMECSEFEEASLIVSDQYLRQPKVEDMECEYCGELAKVFCKQCAQHYCAPCSDVRHKHPTRKHHFISAIVQSSSQVDSCEGKHNYLITLIVNDVRTAYRLQLIHHSFTFHVFYFFGCWLP